MSSFVKKINTAPQLYRQRKGVTQASNGQYLVSTGNQSLDKELCGGLFMGSLVVLLEDRTSQYYGHILKTYLAEGVVREQVNVVVDPEPLRTKQWWLKFLPAVQHVKQQVAAPLEETSTSSESTATTEESKEPKLQVAWRYQDMLEEKMLGVASTGKAKEQEARDLTFRYDNSKPMGNSVANLPSHQLNKEDFVVRVPYDQESTESTLVTLWEQICEEIQNNLAQEDDERIFRLLLPNFDQFIGPEPSRRDITAVIRFLRCLKTMVRATNCICLISVEESLLTPHLAANLKFLADQVLQITSFKDHAEMRIGEYDGTLRVLKHARLHTLISAPVPETDVFALKLSSKQGLVVERIHLDPEEDRADQDENLMQKGGSSKGRKAGGSAASVACNPTKQHKIDF